LSSARGSSVVANTNTAYSTFAPPQFFAAGQPDLPAVSSSMTITAHPADVNFYMAAY
jgi:hypothetical protein